MVRPDDMKMPNEHVFGHENVCCSSRESENGYTGHRPRKRMMRPDDVRLPNERVFGHENVLQFTGA